MTTDTKHIKRLILGGGISGVSLGHFLDGDNHIIEKEMTLGGLCRSFSLGNSIFDFSGHFMHFKDKSMEEYIKMLIKKHGTAEFNEYARDAAIFINDAGENKVIDYPFQANIHQLDKVTFIQALADLYKVHHTHDKKATKSFYDLAVNQFGEKIVDLFFRPYNEKLYRTPLESLDADAMGRFIPSVSFSDVMKNISQQQQFGYNSTFLYSPTSGIQGVVDAIVKDKELSYSLDETVESIDVHNKLVKTNKNTYSYDVLLNTLPLPVFSKLIDIASAPALSSVDVDVYNITYTKDVSRIGKRAWVYFPGDSLFYRVGFYNFMSGRDETSVYVEVSRKSGEDTNIYSIEEIDAELKRVGVISNDAVIEQSQLLTIAPAYAILEPHTLPDVEKYFKQLEEYNIFSTGRYGRWKYQSIEDNILDAKQLAEFINLNK